MVNGQLSLFSPNTNCILEAVFSQLSMGLRCGEFTVCIKNVNPSLYLIIADLIIHSNYYSIPLKHSKTDKEKKGVSVIISQIRIPVPYSLQPATCTGFHK